MTKRFVSILITFVMLLGMLPMSVFAADESTVITITNDNVNDASDAYLVDDDRTLWLGGGTGMGGTYSFVLGPNPDESAFTFWGLEIGADSTVQGGKAVFKDITNHGTISGGSFDPESNGVLYVKNTDTGEISGGTFNGNQEGILSVENNYGTISGGTFSKGILNMGGTIANGVNATVAQGGDLAITMQNLGTGSITVKQKGIDIPYGKAGETYNVAASGGTLVGLYMLTEGETVPAGNYAIESDFRAVAAGLGGYDFTMPNEAVTIVAVFDGYEPTEISIWPHIIEGTDAASLEAAQGIDYEIPPLTSFTEEITLPGDAVPGFITYEDARYDFAGFILSEYNEATDTVSYSLSQTLTIAAEPAQGTEKWDEWHTPISDGLTAAYMLHTHSYDSDTDTTCDCGYKRIFTIGTVVGEDVTAHTEVKVDDTPISATVSVDFRTKEELPPRMSKI